MSRPGLVRLYSGSEYAERPTAFEWEGQRLEVTAVVARWRTPDGKVFKVATQDQREFLLIYWEEIDEWQVQPAIGR